MFLAQQEQQQVGDTIHVLCHLLRPFHISASDSILPVRCPKGSTAICPVTAVKEVLRLRTTSGSSTNYKYDSAFVCRMICAFGNPGGTCFQSLLSVFIHLDRIIGPEDPAKPSPVTLRGADTIDVVCLPSQQAGAGVLFFLNFRRLGLQNNNNAVERRGKEPGWCHNQSRDGM